ncbi:Ribosome biogenesis protein Brix [Giardia muris]|uniref:Ribosome biogenesis protein Brix n=1 Tax=Giardia muris TaxID=5742 RepID=A0A4Z1T0B4_GIAMU|nr:Ribosome biogenesis protein Brix [Giardia muris]|eukprot:TNJ27333.1 Ribosome biogenesis protein Brix [Giardia muris]
MASPVLPPTRVDEHSGHAYPAHKVLMIKCKGTTTAYGRLKSDMERLIPHHKKDPRFENRLPISTLAELIRLRTCDHAIFWEVRHRKDLTWWLTSYPHGPTVKLQVTNLHPSDALRFRGNFRRFTRPVLSFSHDFNEKIELRICKELFKRVFSTPYLHHKSAPFVDHVIAFRVREDGISIDVRVYSITANDNVKGCDPESLEETGPSFTLIPFMILSAVMAGDVLWTNPNFVSPGQRMKILREQEQQKKISRMKAVERMRNRDVTRPIDPIDLCLTRQGFEDAFGPIETSGNPGGSIMRHFTKSHE